MTKINSNNEWGRLRSVILGNVNNYNFSKSDPFYNNPRYKLRFSEKGPADPDKILEQNLAVSFFKNKLEEMDVEVLTPIDQDFPTIDGFGNYCPRDIALVVGDKVILTPTVWPKRRLEWKSILHHLGENYIEAPKDKDIEFDAANIIRFGKDLLYLVGMGGNLNGLNWLQETLGDEYKVHALPREIYAGLHLDSTIMPLREGLVLLNTERVRGKEHLLPEFLKSWDKMWVEQDDLITDPEYTHLTSNWIGMNILSYDENTVFADSRNIGLVEKLKTYNIEVIDIHIPHGKYFLGGHHCCTLDLARD